jgi:hypothetical protein
MNLQDVIQDEFLQQKNPLDNQPSRYHAGPYAAAVSFQDIECIHVGPIARYSGSPLIDNGLDIYGTRSMPVVNKDFMGVSKPGSPSKYFSRCVF